MSEFLKLRKTNCKNCYKCIRHCPVKSIRFSGNQAHIVGNECILCGQCFVVCPQVTVPESAFFCSEIMSKKEVIELCSIPTNATFSPG